MAATEGGGERFEISFLGTAAAALSPGTNTSSQLVRMGEAVVMVDCGVGAVRQLAATGVAPADLRMLLLTHWHPDHTAGLPALLRRRGLRAERLAVHAPPPPRGVWTAIRAAAARGTRAELHAALDGAAVRCGRWQLEPIATEHGPASLGWAVWEQGGRRLVISGDTRPISGVERAASGADLLVHEATFLVHHGEKATASGHSTAREAAELAARAGVRALALTHLPDRYERHQILAEARLAFPEVIVPEDLDRIRITAERVCLLPRDPGSA